MEKSSKGEQG
jgi:predicted RNA-binding Zn-ribbon protein involved in translation (DUF1610 family)